MKTRQGFTLVEAVVVTFLVLLAAVATSYASRVSRQDASGIFRDAHGTIYCPHCHVETEQHWPYQCKRCNWRYQ